MGRRRGGSAVLAERRSRPPAERTAGELAGLRDRHGALTREGDFEPEDALRGRWRLRGERGHVELEFTMAPTVPPLVETLSVESVLPPSGRLGELAAVAVQLASEPDAAALDGLLAPGTDAAEALRGLRVAAALYGPFGEPEAVGGTGETATRCASPAPAEVSTSSSSSTRAGTAWRPSPCARRPRTRHPARRGPGGQGCTTHR